MVCGSHGMLATWVVGLWMFIVGLTAIVISTSFIKDQIKERVVLQNGSDTYEEWLEPDMPIYMQIYIFNVSNPAQVENGSAKPILTQHGPYTYREYMVKYDVIHNHNGTITYKQRKTYHFDREMSVGDDSQNITSINIPLLTLVEALRYENGISKELVKIITNILSKLPNEQLFITRSVHELVWGYHDPMLGLGQIFDKSRFYTDFVGVLMNHNETYDGVYTVHSGVKDISLLGHIDKFNGSRTLPFWTSHIANMVNGSDGSVFAPFVTKSDTLRMFLTDLCRSVYVTYSDTILGKDNIPLYRFQAPYESLEKPSLNPDNAGFCIPKGNCLGSGVLNISVCQTVDGFHIPIISSSPHFYQAEKQYQHAVQGMNPNPDWHSTDVDVEPNTGILMKVAKRLQINIQLAPLSGVTQVEKVDTIIFPILWLNESMVIDDDHASMVKNDLLIPKLIVSVAAYTITVVGGLLVMLGIAFTSLHHYTVNNEQSTYVKFDNDIDDDSTVSEDDNPYSGLEDNDSPVTAEIHGNVQLPSPALNTLSEDSENGAHGSSHVWMSGSMPEHHKDHRENSQKTALKEYSKNNLFSF